MRLASNFKLAKGVTYDKLNCLGGKFQSRDKLSMQVTPNMKIDLVASYDLKKTFTDTSNMIGASGVNLEFKL